MKRSLSTFSKQFWAARKLSTGGDKDGAKASFNRMLRSAERREQNDEALLCRAALIEIDGEYNEALSVLGKIAAEGPLYSAGLVSFLSGSVQSRLGDYDEAIRCYQEAIDTPNYDKPGSAWYNIGLCYHRKGDYDEAIRCFQKAIDTPNYDTPGSAWYNMGIAYDNKGNCDEAIRCYQVAIDTPDYDTPGSAWNNMGIAYKNKGNHDEAIRCYQKALDTPNYDAPGYAWNNLGVAYGTKGDHDEAIRCYQVAIDTPDCYASGHAWNNKGVAYQNKRDYVEAIRCYQKALDTPDYDAPGRAWNNMGIAYRNKGDDDEAIRCYQRALDTPNYDTPGDAWNNMGISYERLGRLEEAISCLTSAVEQYEKSSDPRAAYARKRLEALSVTPAERSGSDAAFLLESAPPSSGDSGSLSPADKMWAKIAETEQTAYQKYADQRGNEQDYVLAILKGWGSAVPIIQSAETGSRGGGYFLKWGGKGLVIDPGFDFLRNFHESGFHGREIAAVAITHNHTDHNQDLGLIEDLFYEMNKGSVPSGKDAWHYTMIVDGDTFAANAHRLDHRMSYRNTPLQFRLTDFEYNQHQPHSLNEVAQLPFIVDYFKAQHSSDVPKAVGIKVVCLNEDGKPAFTLGYSSDTGFFDDLCTDKCLGRNLDVLVADVSQPDRAEKDEPDKLKESHLGLHGLIKLIEGCSPKMTIISEFWSGLSDVRLEMARELRHYFKCDSIFPGGLGLYIDPRNMTIRCSECRKYHPFRETVVVRSSDQYGPLGYVCSDCRV